MRFQATLPAAGVVAERVATLPDAEQSLIRCGACCCDGVARAGARCRRCKILWKGCLFASCVAESWCLMAVDRGMLGAGRGQVLRRALEQ